VPDLQNLPNRKSKRFKHYNYSQNGSYFITICTQGRANLFGDVCVGADSISARTELSHAGEMIERIFVETINAYESVVCDIYVIMPNHFHCILTVARADIESAPTGVPGMQFVPAISTGMESAPTGASGMQSALIIGMGVESVSEISSDIQSVPPIMPPRNLLKQLIST